MAAPRRQVAPRPELLVWRRRGTVPSVGVSLVMRHLTELRRPEPHIGANELREQTALLHVAADACQRGRDLISNGRRVTTAAQRCDKTRRGDAEHFWRFGGIIARGSEDAKQYCQHRDSNKWAEEHLGTSVASCAESDHGTTASKVASTSQGQRKLKTREEQNRRLKSGSAMFTFCNAGLP